MREDDESCVLGEVQTLDPFKDFPRNDTAPSGCCPGLCYSHPDPHQMAVRPSLLDSGVSAQVWQEHKKTLLSPHFWLSCTSNQAPELVPIP